MINGFEVITLCGSTKFKKEFQEYARSLGKEIKYAYPHKE